MPLFPLPFHPLLCRLVGGLALLSVCACSTLKMPGLHDARVLPEGEWAVSLQGTTAASIDQALLAAGHGQDSILGVTYDSGGYAGTVNAGADPLIGANFARGMGNGWELNGGADVSPFGPGCVMVDLGLKKRLYANPRLLLTAYGRVALGSTPNEISYRDGGSNEERIFSLETQSYQAEAELLSLVRIFPRLSWYFNAGPTAGSIVYDLRENSNDAAFQGNVPVYGIKTQMGITFEAQRFEMLWEWGANFLNYGYVPSLGARFAYKTGWAE